MVGWSHRACQARCPKALHCRNVASARPRAHRASGFAKGERALKGVFRTKNIANILAAPDSHESLRRTLRPLQLSLLGVGAIIGAGIFSTVGTAGVLAVQRQMRRRGLRWLLRHGHLDGTAIHILDTPEHAGGWSVDASVHLPARAPPQGEMKLSPEASADPWPEMDQTQGLDDAGWD